MKKGGGLKRSNALDNFEKVMQQTYACTREVAMGRSRGGENGGETAESTLGGGLEVEYKNDDGGAFWVGWSV